MQRHDRARREHRTLHTLLSAAGDERADVGELSEFSLVDPGLPAGRKRRADLRHDQTDLAGRNLHPRVLLDTVDGPEAERDTGHQQVGLIAGFPRERHRTGAFLLPSPAFDHQADFVGTEPDDGLRGDDDGERAHEQHDEIDRVQGELEHGRPPSAGGVS